MTFSQARKQRFFYLLFSSQQSHSRHEQLGQSYGELLVLHSDGRQLQFGHLASDNFFPIHFFYIQKQILQIFFQG